MCAPYIGRVIAAPRDWLPDKVKNVNTYVCLKRQVFEDREGYCLAVIRSEDKQLIRKWRNAQIETLRQSKPLSVEEQERYFCEVLEPSFQEKEPKQILFSFIHAGELIGYGGLVHIEWIARRAEVSYLINPARFTSSNHNEEDFRHFLALLEEAAFVDLKFHKLTTETYAFRKDLIISLEKFGFRREGTLKEHIYKAPFWYDSILHGLLNLETAVQEGVNVPSSMAFSRLNSSEPAMCVLITSLSQKIPLIEAVRHALQQAGRFPIIHGCDSDSFCIGKFAVDHFWNCPILKELNPMMIIEYCRKNEIGCVIPTRDADLEFYAQHAALFEENAIDLFLSPLETIELCRDKKKFADSLMLAGLPAIPTYTSLDKLAAQSYVVKERKGSGSSGVKLDLALHDALSESRHLKEPIFQPFIKGVEWSVDVYRSFDGVVKGVVARQRNKVEKGESQITTTVHYPALEKLGEQLADHVKVRGHALFQVIESLDGSFHVVECNPRFGGASTASLAVGLNSFLWFFWERLGKDLRDVPFSRASDIRQIRYPTDRVIPWSSSLT